jgi:hypothetical protein
MSNRAQPPRSFAGRVPLDHSKNGVPWRLRVRLVQGLESFSLADLLLIRIDPMEGNECMAIDQSEVEMQRRKRPNREEAFARGPGRLLPVISRALELGPSSLFAALGCSLVSRSTLCLLTRATDEVMPEIRSTVRSIS